MIGLKRTTRGPVGTEWRGLVRLGAGLRCSWW